MYPTGYNSRTNVEEAEGFGLERGGDGEDIIHRTQAALDRGVEEELAGAFKDVLNGTSNADSTAAEYLFLSDANGEDFDEELEAAWETLTAAYPLLINDDPDDIVDPDFDDIF